MRSSSVRMGPPYSSPYSLLESAFLAYKMADLPAEFILAKHQLEPKNGGLEDDFPFFKKVMFRFHVNFQGVKEQTIQLVI